MNDLVSIPCLVWNLKRAWSPINPDIKGDIARFVESIYSMGGSVPEQSARFAEIVCVSSQWDDVPCRLQNTQCWWSRFSVLVPSPSVL